MVFDDLVRTDEEDLRIARAWRRLAAFFIDVVVVGHRSGVATLGSTRFASLHGDRGAATWLFWAHNVEETRKDCWQISLGYRSRHH